jgi:hypothetical protein
MAVTDAAATVACPEVARRGVGGMWQSRSGTQKSPQWHAVNIFYVDGGCRGMRCP